MAPEQLEGKEADPRTDIFAFGTVLYEMATGTRALDRGSHASLIAAIMHHEPAPLADRQQAAPFALERVVRKCLAKLPDARWQSAGDLADALSGSRGNVSRRCRVPLMDPPSRATARVDGHGLRRSWPPRVSAPRRSGTCPAPIPRRHRSDAFRFSRWAMLG